MPDGSTLLLFIGAGAVLVSLPGPAVIYVVMQSLDQGRRAGMISVLGIGTSTFCYTLLAATAVLVGSTAASETGIVIIRYLGAAYLTYLGVRKLLERDHPDSTISSARSRHYLGGLIIQTFNPKIAIFFLALLPQFVRPSAGPMVVQILIFGTIFTLLAMLCNGGYVLIAGAFGGWLRGSPQARRTLIKLSGCVYIGLGVSAALAGTASHVWGTSDQDLAMNGAGPSSSMPC
jgi:threonine/homoserine/homoserine lactone efflux protein